MGMYAKCCEWSEHEAVVLIQLREAEARLVVRIQLLRILEEREQRRDQRVDAGHDANRNLAPPPGRTTRGFWMQLLMGFDLFAASGLE